MPQIPKELEEQVKAAGDTLLQPPSSADELLPLLDRTESLLAKIEQSPTKTMHNALSPVMLALVSEKLLKHSDADVKVAVASCISEITRITAPEAPYDDDKMKDVFQLMVSSFEGIADTSSRSHAKRATILETVCKVRSCVIMLDLECDQMIIEMFQHFLKAIRDNHSDRIFTNMETIMSLILEESEDISLDMLKPILSALKNNEIVSPIAKKLAERVIRGCSDKIKPYLPEAFKTLGTRVEDYSEVVASVCRGDNGTCAQSNDSILRAPPVVKESTEETDPQDKDLAVHTAPKSTEGDGVNETLIEEIAVDANSPKKADSDNASDAKVSKTESGHMDGEEPELEAKVDEVAKRKESQSTSENDSAGSSDALDGKKQSEQVPTNQEHAGEKTPDEVIPEAPASQDDAKDASIDPPPSEEIENEDANVTSPKKSGSLPEQSQVKRSARTKRKGILVKKGTASIHTVPKKVTVGDLSGAQRQQRSGKGQPSKKASETKLVGEGQSENNDGSASDSDTDSQPPTENVKVAVEENVSRAKKHQGSGQKQSLKKTKDSALAEEGDPKSDGESESDSETNSLDQTEKLKVASLEKKMSGAKKPQRSGKKKPAKKVKKKAVIGKHKPKNDGLNASDSETDSVDEKVLSDEEENVSGAKHQHRSGKKLSAKKTKRDSPLIGKDELKNEVGDASNSETDSLDQMEASDEETISGAKEVQRLGKIQPLKKFSMIGRGELKNEVEGASDSETKSLDDMDVSHDEISSGTKKPQRSRKKPPAKKAKKDSSLGDSEDDGGSASDSDTNLLVQTGMLRAALRKRDNASSSRKEDGKKGGVFKTKPEKDVSESSARDDVEDMVTSPRPPLKSGKDQKNHEETPKTSNKRKRTPAAEKASGNIEYGENLVGSEVKVWWPKDKAFYLGVVDSFDSVKKKHKVLYVDGDEEILNMKREKWEFVGDSVLGKRVDHPSDDVSSDMKKKHKGTSSSASAKPIKMDSMDKSKSKDAAPKSKGKAKEDDKVKLKSSSKPSAKSDDETSKPNRQRLAGKSHDDSARSSGKSRDADAVKTPVQSRRDSDKASKAGKTKQSVKAPGSSGSAPAKSGSSKAKQTEKLVESAKSPEAAKGKSQDASKSRDGDAKSGKKRRR